MALILNPLTGLSVSLASQSDMLAQDWVELA
jgi:hypothetical protein